MKFSIITPSLNQLPYLKRCVASVADQQGVEIEHIVIDGGSTDGTVEWLTDCVAHQPSTRNNQLSFISEADAGMYEALNKGLDRASGDCIAWLNCDEQYLLGALGRAANFFGTHPAVDLLNGNALIIDRNGGLLGFWKSMPLRRAYLASGYLYNLSCAMFFRAAVLNQKVRFNPTFKAAGDQDMITRLLQRGARSGLIHSYLAAYTFDPENLSEQDVAIAEWAGLRKQVSGWMLLLRPVLRIIQRGERVLRGCRMQRFPLKYALHVDDESGRKPLISNRVPAQWPGIRNKNG